MTNDLEANISEKEIGSEGSASSTTDQSTEVNQREKQEVDLERNLSNTLPAELPEAATEGKNPKQESNDPNVVDWERGQDDPRRAVNWSNGKKWSVMAAVTAVTFLSPLTSSLVAPGVPKIQEGLHFTSSTLGSFVVSIYLLGYVVGPLILAPLSEIYGRLPVYHINNVLFVIWQIACALSPNIGALMVFRFFAGIAGSCPLTIGGGSIADLFLPHQRGTAMALYSLGPLMGPVLGPVAGGYLAQAENWPWLFWVLAIASGAAACLSAVLMRETYEPVLLQRYVNNLKKETGNPNLRSKLNPNITHAELIKRSIVRPTRMLFLSPIVFLLSLYMAITYGYLYLLFTTLEIVFTSKYGFSQGSVGLAYLGIGVGSLIGVFIFGAVSDRLLKALQARNNGAIKPEFRLPIVIPGSVLLPIGLFWYGWSSDKQIHWIMPIIGTGFVGLGMLCTFMPIQLYLVDAFTIYAASALAAATVFRSLLGAFLPLAGPDMYAALGLGWGNSLLGFISCLFIPVTFALYKYGDRIRQSKWDKFAATDK